MSDFKRVNEKRW